SNPGIMTKTIRTKNHAWTKTCRAGVGGRVLGGSCSRRAGLFATDVATAGPAPISRRSQRALRQSLSESRPAGLRSRPQLLHAGAAATAAAANQPPAKPQRAKPGTPTPTATSRNHDALRRRRPPAPDRPRRHVHELFALLSGPWRRIQRRTPIHVGGGGWRRNEHEHGRHGGRLLNAYPRTGQQAG